MAGDRRLEGRPCWMAEIQEVRADRLRRGASNVAKSVDRLQWLKVRSRSHARGRVKPKDRPGTQVAANAGAERQPPGREALGDMVSGPEGLTPSRGGPRGPPGAARPPRGCPCRHPRTRCNLPALSGGSERACPQVQRWSRPQPGWQRTMTIPPNLTEDAAVQQFLAVLRGQWGAPSEARVPETPEQAEARRFRCAEEVLRLVCPDPRVCPDRQCRRRRLCRHFLDLHAQQRAGRSPNPRRTPGAAALRRAMWLYVNGRRA